MTETEEKGSRTSPLAALGLVLFGVGVAAGLLLVAELVLGLFHVGPPKDPFVKAKVGGEDYYFLNRRISELFFPSWATKPPGYESFPARKGPRTLRIFVTGESSTAGDPFGTWAAFPTFLREMLRDAAPERDYQVVNCGVVAISSLDVLAIHKRLLKYDPDLIVIYSGHNEAYGADGVDSPVQRTFANRTLAKASLWFRNLRLIRLVRDLLARAGIGVPEEAKGRGFGMWLMKRHELRSCDPRHRVLLEQYRANVLEMLATARSEGVDVVLCTNLSNVRDQSPMGSRHGCDFPQEKAGAFDAAFRRGVSLMKEERWEEAAEAFRTCIGLDPEYAESHFRLGRCLDALGDSAAAFKEYRKARNLDAVHFRACEAQNEVLREIARRWDTQGRHHLIFVDLDSLLYAEHPFGPGLGFFTEHLHPFPSGHAWMARAIVEALARSPVAERFGPWDLERIQGGDVYLKRIGANALDLVSGLYLTDTYKLTKWPFTQCYENGRVRTFLRGRIRELEGLMGPEEQELYRQMLAGDTRLLDFGWRHYRLSVLYRRQRRAQEALRELGIAKAYYWPDPTIETDMVLIYVGLRQLGEAQKHLQRAREIDPRHPDVHFAAGALYHAQGRILEAREEFLTYLEKAPQGPRAPSARRALNALGGLR